MKCHYEGTGVFEGLCLGTKECDSCIGYKRCTAFKPEYKTNADRIRAMSDEELARFFVEDDWDRTYCTEYDRLDGNPLLRDERCDEKCEQHCLEWIKQPVKDGGDE